jgi:hypothetical protein
MCSQAWTAKERTMKCFYKMIFIACAVAVLGVGVTSTPAAEQDRACAADAKKFCPDVKGGGPLRECLEKRLPDLSPGCQATLTEAKPRQKPSR